MQAQLGLFQNDHGRGRVGCAGEALGECIGDTEIHIIPRCSLERRFADTGDFAVISDVRCDGGCYSIRHLRIPVDIDFRGPKFDVRGGAHSTTRCRSAPVPSSRMQAQFQGSSRTRCEAPVHHRVPLPVARPEPSPPRTEAPQAAASRLYHAFGGRAPGCWAVRRLPAESDMALLR